MKKLCLFGCSARRCTTGRRTDRINNSFHMTRHIGSTTYKVKVVLAEDGKETITEKILRMMRNEMLELGQTVVYLICHKRAVSLEGAPFPR